MSYCNQTVSGAMAVEDLGFHTFTRTKMLEYIPTSGVHRFRLQPERRADSLDISLGFSTDANGNGIPDECEDCNHNSVLDSIDIASAFSHDVKHQRHPDECEPDCNNNNVPTSRDILLGRARTPTATACPMSATPTSTTTAFPTTTRSSRT
jgi:hypothetical protein